VVLDEVIGGGGFGVRGILVRVFGGIGYYCCLFKVLIHAHFYFNFKLKLKQTVFAQGYIYNCRVCLKH